MEPVSFLKPLAFVNFCRHRRRLPAVTTALCTTGAPGRISQSLNGGRATAREQNMLLLLLLLLLSIVNAIS